MTETTPEDLFGVNASTLRNSTSTSEGGCVHACTSSRILDILLILLIGGIGAFAVLTYIYQDEYIASDQRNNESREKISILNKECDALNKEIKDLSNEIDDLQRQVKAKDEEIKKREETIQQLNKENEELMTKLKQLNLNKTANAVEISKKQEELDNQIKNYNENEKKIKTLDAELKSWIALIDGFKKQELYYQIGVGISVVGNIVEAIFLYINKAEADRLIALNKVYQDDIKKSRDDITNLNKQIEGLMNDYRNLTNEIGIRNQTIDRLNESIKILQAQKDTVGKEIEQLKTQKGDLEKTREAAIKKLGELKAAYDSLLKQNQTLTIDYGYLLGNYTILKKKYDDQMVQYIALNDTCNNMTRDLVILKGNTSVLNITNALLEKSCEFIAKDTAALQAKSKDLENLINITITNTANLTVEYKKLNDTYNELNKATTALKEKYENLKKDVKTLGDTLEALKKKKDTLIKTYDANLLKLRADALSNIKRQFIKVKKGSYINQTLLYSGVRDGFTKEKFEEKVGTNQSILILIGTQDYSYFGGFLNASYNKTSGNHMDPLAFTFSRNYSALTKILNPNLAYDVNTTKIISFGLEDIVIYNQSNANLTFNYTSGFVNAGQTYKIPDGYDNSTFYHKGSNFNITSFEVYWLKKEN